MTNTVYVSSTPAFDKASGLAFSRPRFDNHNREGRLLNLVPLERRAMVLVDLISEVNNGGFSQWHANGYAIEWAVKDALNVLTKTPATETVRYEVNKAFALIKAYSERGYAAWLTRDEEEREREELLEAALEELDESFYNALPDFKEVIEAYFKTQEGAGA